MSEICPSVDRGRMRFRKLRIAWSVWWGIVAVSLVALWIRSYWCHDLYHLNHLASCAIDFESVRGGVVAWSTKLPIACDQNSPEFVSG